MPEADQHAAPTPGRPTRREAPHTISVVVPALNAAATLPDQLDALRSQRYDGPWELLIADNGSRDATVATARRQLHSFPSARIIDASGVRGAGRARNVGAANSSGDFLAFTDADDVVSADWLSALADSAQHADLVAGGVEMDALSDHVVRSWHTVSPRERALRSHRFLPYASGTNLGIWTDVFHRLGGFDEQMRFGEDIELSWRAQLNSCLLAASADAVVHYRLRGRPAAVLLQHHRYGTASPQLYRRFRTAGMPRPRSREAISTWARLVLALPSLPWSSLARGRWCIEGGLASGRIVGSLRNRVLFF
jgi:glycosyltransferase involved in cell wall biosynthesis